MNNVLNNLQIPITKPIAFFHLPKTAGTNFTYIIENNYKDTCKNVNYKYIDKKTNEFKCAFGHHAFKATYNNDCIIFVFLRNPIERVISHFVEHKNNQYCHRQLTLGEVFLRRPEHYFGKEYPNPILAKRIGFNGNAMWASNFYCRALTDNGFYGKEPYPITEDIADGIIENIKNNTLFYNGKHVPCIFGITEKFKQSTDLFAKLAGWKTTDYKEKSKSRAYNGGKRRCPVSDKLVDQIALRNQLDTKIYKAACEQFDVQLEFFKGKSE